MDLRVALADLVISNLQRCSHNKFSPGAKLNSHRGAVGDYISCGRIFESGTWVSCRECNASITASTISHSLKPPPHDQSLPGCLSSVSDFSVDPHSRFRIVFDATVSQSLDLQMAERNALEVLR